MKRKLLFIIAGLVVVAGVACIGIVVLAGGLSLGLTQPAADTGDKFMTDLKDGDFDQAYGMCAPGLQKALVSASALAAKIKKGNAQPTGWTFTSRKVNGKSAELVGDATFAGSVTGAVRLNLDETNNTWRISAFNLMPR